MTDLFWRQFKSLCYKNAVVFRAHWFANLLRCLVVPIAYGVFLGYPTNFFSKPNNFGLGTPVTLYRVEDHFDGSRPIVWVDTTDGSGYIKAQDIMSHVTSGFNTAKQRHAVINVATLESLFNICISNANGASGCFMALSFDGIPKADKGDTRAINYTIRGDAGAFFVDVTRHTSDLETRLIPLQWAVDQAIIELTTGKKTPNPLELPFTHEINTDTSQDNRLQYLDIMGHFSGVAFFLVYVGIVYHISGGVAFERASGLTSHMQAMGALDSARIMSWYISVSILYISTWIILAVFWWKRLFTQTSLGYMVLVHLVTGFGITGWSFFFSVPFNRSPQMAAVVTSGLAVVLSVIPLMLSERQALCTVLSFFFPSMFYTFMLKDFAGWEVQLQHPILDKPDPIYFLKAEPMIIAAAISVVFWPCAAIYFERLMYGVSNPSNNGIWPWFRKADAQAEASPNTSISIRNVRKVFNTSVFRRKSTEVVAIADLTIDIPSNGIFVLLGPNGAGKSTCLSILGGLTNASSGAILFSGNTTRPPRGTLGLVPQKNVLFPELTVMQTLRVWNAIKQVEGSYLDLDIESLVRDCDLQDKIHDPAGTLSGGQKRKLQLAIGLVGGSKVILVDECTSGVDPLSRRALWKTLTTYRGERTIILTTHFLDEADFLADQVAVLAAPGKLIASDSPVALKSTMGQGYSISVRFRSERDGKALLHLLQTIVPSATMDCLDLDHHNYHLNTRDASIVAASLRLVENRKVQLEILGYDVLGTTMEDIFLDLLNKEELGISSNKHAPDDQELLNTPKTPQITLSNGRPRSTWAQVRTVFYKRSLIIRRSWLGPFLALAVGIFGAWWPIRFVQGGFVSCVHKPLDGGFVVPELPPTPPFANAGVLAAPLNLDSIINSTLPELFVNSFQDPFDPVPAGGYNPFLPVPDKDTLVKAISDNFLNFSTQGGLYMDFDKNEYLIAYELQLNGLEMFSLASNLFYNRALNSSAGPSGSRRISPTFDQLPSVQTESLKTLEWLAVFGAAMSVFPAFFTIYVAKERRTSVQAMQLSNGLSNPLGLWLGHFMFDAIPSFILATVIAIVYSVVKNKFQGVGLMWLVIVLYCLAATLLSYVASIIVKSPLGAFAAVVVLQFIIYLLYLTAYIATMYSANPLDAPRTMNIIYFTLALVSPINSLIRASLISVNQFSLLCDGEHPATGSALVTVTRFGGPIIYLILWILVLLFILSRIDTGIKLAVSNLISQRQKYSSGAYPLSEKGFTKGTGTQKPYLVKEDVATEVEHAYSPSNSDPLRVLGVSKSFGRKKVVDDVTFTIPHSSLFVLLGPNGAGKTTTFDMIYGHLPPDTGDVFVNNTSVLSNVRKARSSFGVCPQFTAMDAHLTVREHLVIYGSFRGLSGDDLQHNIKVIMDATGLDVYSSRLASKISGGNQRKLALAIALIGNPSVVLVDEYSTGIDAKMKRELWSVLKQITKDKSVFLTTHSMEEASYLATKVGIMSKRMLAIGSPEELEARNASYEVHFSCHSREELLKVQTVMAKIPNARMVDDVATRFEVPIGPIYDHDHDEISETGITVASIFDTLPSEKNFPEFTIGKSSLETAFIRIINENHHAEEKMV